MQSRVVRITPQRAVDLRDLVGVVRLDRRHQFLQFVVVAQIGHRGHPR